VKGEIKDRESLQSELRLCAAVWSKKCTSLQQHC